MLNNLLHACPKSPQTFLIKFLAKQLSNEELQRKGISIQGLESF